MRQEEREFIKSIEEQLNDLPAGTVMMIQATAIVPYCKTADGIWQRVDSKIVISCDHEMSSMSLAHNYPVGAEEDGLD